MLKEGLEEEARNLMAHRELPALQTVGYQEWWAYFAGEQSLQQTIELIQRNSRRYAKRQLTWNRRDGYWKLIPGADLRTALTYIHLVQTEHLHLQAYPAVDLPPMLHPKEQRRRVALVHSITEQISAVADLALWKDITILQYWADADCSTTAQAVIMHEACRRAESAEVFAIPKDEEQARLLTSQGWQKAKPETVVPAALQARFSGTECRVWQRAEQPF